MINSWKPLRVLGYPLLLSAVLLNLSCYKKGASSRVNTLPGAPPAAIKPDTAQAQFYYSTSIPDLSPDRSGRVRLEIAPDSIVKVQIDSVQLLQLADDGDDTTFPKAVFKYKNLKFLGVGMRGFRTFPAGISRLQHLEEIDFQHGFLEQLPDDFCQLKSLRRAVFLFSNLKELPECIGDLENLEYLHLGFTHIQRFPESMKRLKNLKIILLSQSPDEPHVPESEYLKLKSWLPHCSIDYRLRNVD